jgi:flagellar motor component MotA
MTSRSKQKFAIGVLALIVGLIAVVISLSLTQDMAPLLFAAGLVGIMAGLFEIELSAVWLNIEQE